MLDNEEWTNIKHTVRKENAGVADDAFWVVMIKVVYLVWGICVNPPLGLFGNSSYLLFTSFQIANSII